MSEERQCSLQAEKQPPQEQAQQVKMGWTESPPRPLSRVPWAGTTTQPCGNRSHKTQAVLLSLGLRFLFPLELVF